MTIVINAKPCFYGLVTHVSVGDQKQNKELYLYLFQDITRIRRKQKHGKGKTYLLVSVLW